MYRLYWLWADFALSDLDGLEGSAGDTTPSTTKVMPHVA